MVSLDEYQVFLQNKHVRARHDGFLVDLDKLNPAMHDWQKLGCQWSLRAGCSLLSWDCGLGKSLAQLEWAKQVIQYNAGGSIPASDAADGPMVLLLCPIAVQQQTVREAAKFAIDCPIRVVEEQADCKPGISVTNYEKLHHFLPKRFCGVVLDESSVLKNFTGKTKQQLCREFEKTPYRLCCTATPAPNDRMEIGNHAEFLGVMPSNEMLARWFINSGDKVGLYRLRKHGERDFWRWVASWAMCLSSPADIGFDASNYELPPLNVREHVCEIKAAKGFLFPVGKAISATDVHKEKRAYLHERADMIGQIVNDNTDAWAVWCDTDYEADELLKRIPDAIEVRGSETAKNKERKLLAFSDGQERVIVTKSEIAGFGLNWQHCHRTTWFAGYSYERFYQAIRRLWRFGQQHPVDCRIVRTENEGSIMDEIKRKEEQHKEMQREVAALMHDGMMEELGLRQSLRTYQPTNLIALPEWVRSKGA